MNCPKCGFQLNDAATFCPKCGYSIMNATSNNNTYNNYPPQNINNTSGNNNNNNIVLILIAVFSAIIILIVAIIVAFSVWNNTAARPTATPFITQSPAPTVEPTDVPVPTVQVVYVTQEPVKVAPPVSNSNTGYLPYYSSKYNFRCNYPANFIVYDDYGTLTLLTARSPDGMGIEKIVAKPNEGETVNSEFNAFISAHNGYVDYKSVGSDYFAVSVQVGSRMYYKYCKFKNGNLYWFEFESPRDQYDLYDMYINDVYKSFSIN